MIMMKMNN